MSAADEIQKTYAGMSDTEIAKLYESRDDLTDAAREALIAEFRARGLQADEASIESHSTEDAGGDVHLWDFVDAIEASSALSILQSNEVAATLKPYTPEMRRVDGSELVVMQLYVAAVDEDRAVALLRKHKGLFPLPEEHNLDESYAPDDSDMFIVAELDQPDDAEVVCNALSAEQVTFRRTEEQRDGKTIWIIEVPQNDIDRASEAMDRAFQAMATEESDV